MLDVLINLWFETFEKKDMHMIIMKLMLSVVMDDLKWINGPIYALHNCSVF